MGLYYSTAPVPFRFPLSLLYPLGNPMVSGSPILAAFARAAQNKIQSGTTRTYDEASTRRTEDNDMQSVTEPQQLKESTRAHRLHHVLPISTRGQIVKWMCARPQSSGEKLLVSTTVKQFPYLFKGSASANHMRARRLWRDRDRYPALDDTNRHVQQTTSLTRVTTVGLQRTRLKAHIGRERKRSAWVEALRIDVRDEFDRFRRLGVKFNISTLLALAMEQLRNSTNEAYSMNTIDPRSEQELHLKIDRRWIQSFMEQYRIVSRAHTGKHQCSPAKEEELEASVAHHLGTVSGLLSAVKMDENDVENADETHFIINVDNGRTPGFSGDKEVKYADVVSGGEGFTMVVRLTGGRDARIAAPFMIFKNGDRNYPIRGVPDNVPGAAYRTGPKGWMDTTVMPQWLSEPRAITALPHRRRIMYVDNCSGHTATTDLIQATERINTELRYFPPNATHLIQPCDSFLSKR